MGKSILLINGPNLNLLGTREPHIYGSTTLADVESNAKAQAISLGATLESYQSNHEGAIVDRIQAARGNVDGIIINPGAYTHIPWRSGMRCSVLPFLSSSCIDKAAAIIVGLGVYGYKVAVEHVALNFKELEKATL
ncbi:catabolic 3-dehydroquinase [Penicillium herquei]|nr:catabolic 3-dehydroquinase [Penicillium herquei]